MRKFLTLLLVLLFISCQTESQDPLKHIELHTPQGQVIKTKLVFKTDEMQQGLSGVRPDQFQENQGMLFFYLNEDEKFFWMPDTYFDLDLFYLDKDFKILEIIRKLPHYIGRENPERIPKAKAVWCRHVLEMKAGASIGSALKVGDQLKWKSSLNPIETEQKIKTELLKL